jgi:PAS domain S-box-containing protein
MTAKLNRAKITSAFILVTFAATAMVLASGLALNAAQLTAAASILLVGLALGWLRYRTRAGSHWENHGKLVFDLMSEGFVVHDATGAIVWNNGAALEILGLTQEELAGRDSKSVHWNAIKEDGSPFPGEEHPSMVALRTGVASSGTVMGLVRSGGERKWIRINTKPVRFRRRLFVCVTFSDITQLVLSKLESRYALDSLGVGVWKLNPVTQELVWDDSMYKLFEIDQMDFPGHYNAWESALTPEAKATAVEELGRALSGERPFKTTFEIQTKTGLRKHIGGAGKVIRNEKNEPVMMYGVNWDRTKEVLDEWELEKRQKLLTAVLDNIPYTVFVKDAKNELRYTLLNKAGQMFIGTDEKSVVGRNDAELFPPTLARYWSERDQETIQRGTPSELPEEPIETPNGKRWIRSFKVPTYRPDGRPDLLIGIAADITEELQIRETLERERAKSIHTAKLASLGEMSAGIAHEINNPLAILSGGIALLEKFREEPEKFQAKIESMKKSVERIGRIVRSLRSFTRHSYVKSRSWVSVQEMIKEALALTEQKAKRNSTEIRIKNSDPTSIYCDSVEIEQVLVNLIDNAVDAVKHQDEKWVEIRVFEDLETVVLQVIDSGPGIALELQRSIFQPFFTTKPIGEGTGLGLSISKGILEDHKATIDVDTHSKQTCFEIRFPKGKGEVNAV